MTLLNLDTHYAIIDTFNAVRSELRVLEENLITELCKMTNAQTKEQKARAVDLVFAATEQAYINDNAERGSVEQQAACDIMANEIITLQMYGAELLEVLMMRM